MSLVFNVLFTYLFLGRTTSMYTLLTLGMVLLGFWAGVEGEIDFSLIGTSAGVLASAFVSLNSVMTSRMLSYVDSDQSLLLFYNNLNATLLFLPLIFLFEKDVSPYTHSLHIYINIYIYICTYPYSCTSHRHTHTHTHTTYCTNTTQYTHYPFPPLTPPLHTHY